MLTHLILAAVYSFKGWGREPVAGYLSDHGHGLLESATQRVLDSGSDPPRAPALPPPSASRCVPGGGRGMTWSLIMLPARAGPDQGRILTRNNVPTRTEAGWPPASVTVQDGSDCPAGMSRLGCALTTSPPAQTAKGLVSAQRIRVAAAGRLELNVQSCG